MGRRKWHYLWGSVLVVFGIFVVFKSTFAVYGFVSNISFQTVASAIGKDLRQDEQGRTNIVLLGDGGYERDGAGLIDSIMGVSIDWKKGTVAMISIPRDLYIAKNVDVPGRINSLYVINRHLADDERFKIYETVVGDLLDLEMHYYIRIDFNGFVEVVDSLGGVTVNVERSIYDDRYPNATDTGYTLFKLEQGIQEMDGETALKYARSRYDSSDFDRAARQQKLLEAIRNEALGKEVLTSPKAISNIYNAVVNNMNTNLEMLEMLELAAFAQVFDRSNLVNTVLHDDPGQEGGFLAAASMEVYGGYTLLPYDSSLKSLHKYANLIINYPTLFVNSPKIEVLNATRRTGLASNIRYQLNRYGFDVVDTGNYENSEGEREYLDESRFVYYPTPKEIYNNTVNPQIELLLKVLPGFLKGTPTAQTGVLKAEEPFLTIILGEDYEFYVP